MLSATTQLVQTQKFLLSFIFLRLYDHYNTTNKLLMHRRTRPFLKNDEFVCLFVCLFVC